MRFKKFCRKNARACLPTILRVGVFFFAFLLTAPVTTSDAFAAQPSEIEVKLVYLYNFTKFVRWPENAFRSSNDPFRLCIIGEMPPQELTTILRSKSTAGRPFDILLQHENSDISTCHIAFLHQASPNTISKALQNTPDSPTLTVSDFSGFAAKEGIIEFVRDNEKRVRIRINLANAQKRHLTISAKLLETAINTQRYAE